MGGDGRVEDGFPVLLQSSQRARLISSHQARIAHHVGREDCRQFAINAYVGHEKCVPGRSAILSVGYADRHAAPNLSSNKTSNWVLPSATGSEMVSDATHRKRRNTKPVRISGVAIWPHSAPYRSNSRIPKPYRV